MKGHVPSTLIFLVIISAVGVCSARPSAQQGDYSIREVVVPMTNSVVFHRPGKFAAWPANNGVWIWDGKEILVGFAYGDYKVRYGHDISGQHYKSLARSLDGGLTWNFEDPENFAGDGGEAKPSPGGINFAHPDFAMRVGGDEFFISYDRGGKWQGPYKFGEFGPPEGELGQIKSRTDYIVNSADDCFLFTAAGKPGNGTTLSFCMRTTDGGKSFQWVSWIVPPNDPHSGIMSSTVRITNKRVISTIRRIASKEEAWIDAYITEDNCQNWKLLSRVGDAGNWNGNPPALIRLADGRMLCVYGNRTDRKMYAAISNDQGATWPERITIRNDFRKDTEQDLGYPRVVQRGDGKVVTIYYWATDKLPQQHIAATIIDIGKTVVPVKNAKNVIIDGGKGIFCGWPANNGLWTWGNEMVVGFSKGTFEEKIGHNHVTNEQGDVAVLARSFDGGETWKTEDPDNFIGDGGEATNPPGGINFAHPDFAMRVGGDEFYISYDRGGKWQGPYEFGEFGLPEGELSQIVSRTDYLVNSADDCFIFTAVKKPGKSRTRTDRAFCMRTTDGGKSFQWVSWIVPPTDPYRGVMPQTVRCSKAKLVTAVRRRWGKGNSCPCWIDSYVSNDHGKSWSFLSKVGDTGQWNGNPPALTRMTDGRLCCIYGNRSRDQMIARFSSDEGSTWGPEIVLRNDFQVDKFGDNDFGYPRVAQRPDGKLIAIYYWATKEHPEQHIAATIWKQDN